MIIFKSAMRVRSVPVSSRAEYLPLQVSGGFFGQLQVTSETRVLLSAHVRVKRPRDITRLIFAYKEVGDSFTQLDMKDEHHACAPT